MSWQNEGPCNIGTASVAVMLDLLACTCFVFSPFTDQPVALTGIIRCEVSSTMMTRASAKPNLCCVHSTFCCKFCCRSSFTSGAGSFSKHPPARLYDSPSFDRKVRTQRVDGRKATPILSSSTAMTSQMTERAQGHTGSDFRDHARQQCDLCLRQEGWPAHDTGLRWKFLPASRCVLMDLREARAEPFRLRKRPRHVPAVSRPLQLRETEEPIFQSRLQCHFFALFHRGFLGVSWFWISIDVVQSFACLCWWCLQEGDKPSPRFHHAGGSRLTSSGSSSPAMIEAYSTSCQRFLAEGLPTPFAGFGHCRPIVRAFACAAPARSRRSWRSRLASPPLTAHTAKGCCIDLKRFC